jgi:hypothetical protein
MRRFPVSSNTVTSFDASEGELLSKRLRALTNNGKHKLLLNLANLSVFAVFARAS